MKEINISHIEKHLFDKNKHGWDRKDYPLVKIENLKVIRNPNARTYKSVSNILQLKRYK
jgi:hypothetical protein